MRLLDAGIDLVMIAIWVGHASIESTSRIFKAT